MLRAVLNFLDMRSLPNETSGPQSDAAAQPSTPKSEGIHHIIPQASVGLGSSCWCPAQLPSLLPQVMPLAPQAAGRLARASAPYIRLDEHKTVCLGGYQWWRSPLTPQVLCQEPSHQGRPSSCPPPRLMPSVSTSPASAICP